MTRSRCVTIGVAVVLGVCAGGWLLYTYLPAAIRADQLRPEPVFGSPPSPLSDAWRTYSSFTPIDDPGIARAVEAVARAQQALTPAQAAALAEEFATLLRARFASPDPSAYLDWRSSRGYQMRDHAELMDLVGIDAPWRISFGEPLPSHIEPLDMVRRLIADQNIRASGTLRLASIATDSDAMTVAAHVYTRANPLPPETQGPLAASLHTLLQDSEQRMVIATVWPWWTFQNTHRQQLDSTGRVLTANITFIGRFADGLSRPLITSWVWDPKASQWRFSQMSSIVRFDEAIRWEM